MRVAVPAKISEALTFSGRTFSAEDLQLIQQITADFGSLGRTEISRTICELLDWRRPSGRLKNHEGRLLLERLEGLGWVRLPEVRRLGRRGSRRVEWSSQSEWQEKQIGSAGEFEPLEFQVVQGGRDSQLWREWVERYHYLGYRAAGRGPLALSGAWPTRSLGVPVVVFPCLEDSGAGLLDRMERKTAAAKPATDCQQRPISHPALGPGPGTSQ